MGIRKYDRRLKALCLAVIQNISQLELTGDAAEVRDRALARFQKADQLLEAAIAKASAEGVEVSEAETALLEALSAAEGNHKTIYQGLQGSFYLRQARGEAVGGTHTRDLKIYLDGYNPSDFGRLVLSDKVDQMKKAAAHAARFLDAQDFADQIDAAQQAADRLDAAWKALLEEEAEASRADRELRKASDEATRHYRIGRDWISGCLRDVGLEDDLAGLVPAPSSVYSTSVGDDAAEDLDAPQADEDRDEHEEPTPV
jgi:hypothetical protein